ncbi:helix-turn-helix domain-containing protein [Microvirga arvi]|uniref:helix-turn-helix domain-containing protein n=1 Tax=Microvirga arvi TaxID=2778731 RepID=UPI0021065186|nr:helix-turn-helix transcriptional regulator [Microvirga arvi]
MTIFASNLKYFRMKSGLTQEELAEKCGLHRTYIGGIERKERNISLRNVDKISRALNIQPYLLLQERSWNV